jgi:hypothetical protein
MDSRTSILLNLFLSGVAACVLKIAEGAIGTGSPLALNIGAYGVVAAASALGGLLINRASSQVDVLSASQAREVLATRNHHLRRGMARALRFALERCRSVNKDLPANPYNMLFETWNYVLHLADTDDVAMDRFFPIDLTEAQWKAINTYSTDDDEDARAIVELLRTLLEGDAVYSTWGGDEASRFAKDLLPYYRQAFADDLAGDGDGFIKNAFDIKSQSELRSLLLAAIPQIENIRRELTIESWALLIQFQPGSEGFSRFVYDQEVDDFVGRDDVVDHLRHTFLSPRDDDPYKFHWHLVIGSAGVGKSRLGFDLQKNAGSSWPISGFVEPSTIKHAKWFGWTPEQPAFLVVDNVLRDGAGVTRLLDALTLADSHQALAHPVRVLLLERRANVELVESLVSHCDNSRAVEARRYEKEPITLSPLVRSDYLKIARRRDTNKKMLEQLHDDVLDSLLKEIDPECRPLFAALLGEDLSSATDPDTLVSPTGSTRERRHRLLESVIEEERKVWEDIARGSCQNISAAKQLLESHERLLALATITRGFLRSSLEPAAFGPSLYLASEREFDEALYARMSDRITTRDDDFLGPLEPDLIGELFVENLIARNRRVHRALIDLAWRIDPIGSGFFAGLAEIDYGTADTDPMRFLPAASQVTAEIAPIVTQTLRNISRAFTLRIVKANPDTRPPWTIPDIDELETKKSLREQFNQSRQTPPLDWPVLGGKIQS